MNLIIIIPCLNEEKTVANVIKAIPEVFTGVTKRTIIVVDDGSTDNTAQLAEGAGAVVVRHSSNKGVGAAFQTGLEKALELQADVIVNMDGDGQFNPVDIDRLIEPIIKGESDFVTASRFKDSSQTPEMPAIKKWGNKRIASLISFLIGKKFYDVSCGFRAYSKEAALQLNLFGKFTYTQETFLDLAFKGLNIKEVPVKVRGVREFGKSRVASNLFKYAVNTSGIIIRTYRDYRPLKFFSIMSLLMLLIGIIFGGFLAIHYIRSGNFSPHKWAGFVSASFFFISILLFITGLLADILSRVNKTTERLLYYQKKKTYYTKE